MEKNVGEPRFLGRIDDICGGRAAGRHAHVERPVRLKGEAAGGIVELHRGDADVQHHAGGRCEPCLASEEIELAEAALDEGQLSLVLLNECGSRRNRGRVAVDAEDAARRRGRQDRPAVAAAAEGGVNLGLAR